MKGPSLATIAAIAGITMAFVALTAVLELGGLTRFERKIIRYCRVTQACVKGTRQELARKYKDE